MPVTAWCWLTAHADASDPSPDPSPRELVRRLEQRPAAARQATWSALLVSPLGGTATTPVLSASRWRIQWRMLVRPQTRICCGLKRSVWRVGGLAGAATENAAMGERTVRAGFGLWRSVWRSAGSTSEAISASARAGRRRARRRLGRYCIQAAKPARFQRLCGRAELAHGEVPRTVHPAARALGAVSSTPRATSSGALALWRSTPVRGRVD